MKSSRMMIALVAVTAMAHASAQTPTSTASPDGPATTETVPASASTTIEGAVPASLVPGGTAPASAASCCRIAAGTPVELEIVDLINSSQRKRGEKFGLRLQAPIMLDGITVIPAGITGVGEVVHAMPARGGGKPGELLLAGRYLAFAGQQIALRGLKASVSGAHTYNLAFAVGTAIGPFAMFIRGHEIEIPPGARVTAKLANDLVLPALPDAIPAVVVPPVTATDQE